MFAGYIQYIQIGLFSCVFSFITSTSYHWKPHPRQPRIPVVNCTLYPFCFTVTMGFFDDILIPPESLQQPAKLYPDLKCFCEWHKVMWFVSRTALPHVHITLFQVWSWIDFDRCRVVLSYSHSDEAEQVWLWEYETDEGAHDLYMDQGEEIRFRVTDEVFVDTSPTGPATADAPAQPGQSTAPPTEEKKEAPYTLIVRTQFTNNIYVSRTSA